MSKNFEQKIYHVSVNVDLMESKGIQINSGITIKVHVSVKNVMNV